MPKLIMMTSATTTRQIPLKPPLVTIGRATLNDVVLDSQRVSRFHAVLEFNGPFVIVRDLGGRNGTTVNGAKISAVTLGHGDTIAMGDIQLRYLANEMEVVDDADLRLLSIRGDLLQYGRK